MTAINATNVTNATSKAAETVSNQVSEVWLIVGLISTMLLLFFIAFIFLTPIGKESFQRWLNKKKYNKGGYTNAIIFTKDGLAKEIFKSNNKGTFVYDDESYTRVPQLSIPYKGIPTLFYIEGTASPIDIYSRDRHDLLSSNELDTVMHEQSNFDFLAWFNRNKSYIMIGFFIILGALAASLYFNYTIFEWIRDSAPSLKEGVKEIAQSKVTG